MKSFSPYPKNPKIAKFFKEIGLADELGSGVKNMIKYTKLYSGGVPEFKENDIFTTIIPLENKNKSVSQSVSQSVSLEEKIVEYCVSPKSLSEILEYFSFKDKYYFKKNYLNKLINDGKLEMTIPDKPTSRNQKYITVIQ